MREDLKNELYKIALNRARANQFKFSTFLEPDLKEYISKAVERMTYTEYSSDTKRLEAKINTMILADALVADGKERKLTEAIDYKSFNNVRSSICPLWPFC